MENLFTNLKKVTRLLIIIALAVLSVINAITYNVGAPGRFMPFVSNAFCLIFILAIFLTSLALILLKKEDKAYIILLVYAAYYLISCTFNYIASGSLAVSGNGAASIIYGIFYFLGGLLLLAIITFITLIKIFDFKFNKILDLLVVIACGFSVILFIVGLIRYIDWDMNWSAYLSLIEGTLVMPVLLASLYIETRKEAETTHEATEAEEAEVESKEEQDESTTD